MIRLGIVLTYPMVTRSNATPITKESGVEVALDDGEGVLGEVREELLVRRR
jgi:hypothetical protein